MTDQHRQGTTATLLAQFYAYPGGPAANVSGLTVTISPTGGGLAVLGPTSSGVTNESTGLYSYAWAVDAEQTLGTYVVEWNATGDITASEVVEVVDGGAATYASLAELKSRLNISDTNDDTELQLALEAASRWVDGHCHRVFHSGTATRTFVPNSPYVLPVDDLVSVTTLKTDAAGDGTFETTWSASDYQLLPANPSAGPEQRPYTQIRAVGAQAFPSVYGCPARQDRVQIVGVWGWPAVPDPVKQATLVVAAETFKRKDTFAAQGGFGDFGPVVVRRDPFVLDLLNPYRDVAGFA